MLYEKPKNVKYTDMAIYIDNNVYRNDLTEEEENLIFQYLYHISEMLAYKSRYFNDSRTYDDFSVYMATRIFMRLKSHKQYEYRSVGEPKLEKIKSCLNYAKAILYGAKVAFEQEYYSQCLSYEKEEDISYSSEYNFNNLLSDSVDQLQVIDFYSCLGDIPNTVKMFVDRIPFSSEEERSNICISCMLTLLNSITLSQSEKKQLLPNKEKDKFVELSSAFSQKRKQVVLYHLDNSYTNYVKVLAEELRHLISKDLSLILHTYVPTANSSYLLAEINGNEYRFEE